MPAGMPQADDRAGSYPGGRLGGALSDGARSDMKPHRGPRAFNPLRVGSLEAAVWVAYYRREWPRFLVLSILVVRSAFGMDWIRTVHGAWLVLRANQLWPRPSSGATSRVPAAACAASTRCCA